MSDNNGLNISRRRALAGIGAIGVASAGAGVGTSAYFSDTESFENNSITAGELDLKVDWEEHYYNGMGSPADMAEMGDGMESDYYLPAFDLSGTGEEFPDDEANEGSEIGPLASGVEVQPIDGRPIALNWTGENTQDDFWDATAIEAFPDSGDDGGDGLQDPNAIEDICAYDADLDGVLSDPLRTNGTINDQTTGPGDPVINLSDVKPGDFGEVTYSFHLCDNPGYVWLTGDLVDADENGHTEPEAEDEDEYTNITDDPASGNLFDNEGDEVDENGNIIDSVDPEDTEQERVELLDYVLTRMWYDDGNNQVDEIGGQLDVVCATDISGSLSQGELDDLEDGVNDFIDALGASQADVEVGTLAFGDDVNVTSALDDPSNVGVNLPGANNSRGTAMPAALDIADQLVNSEGRSGAQKAIVLFTDGGPNYENREYTASVNGSDYTAPRDDTTAWSATPGDSPAAYDNGTSSKDSSVTQGEMEETAGVAASITGSGTSIATVYVGDTGEDTQAMTSSAQTAYTDLPTYLASSGPIASMMSDAFDVDVDNLGMLASELVELVTTSEEVFFLGTLRQAIQALSNGQGVPLTGDLPAEDGGGSGRNCFSPSNDHYIGFEWWVPINHGNQIQGDSVSFDIGFYTEQCRHNDGQQAAD